ncbi:hypothetical protein B566_EDAN015570 [Ephemera danica]|nr:hypothetical protein B566_EDAN015570 [Ephemera danica]
MAPSLSRCVTRLTIGCGAANITKAVWGWQRLLHHEYITRPHLGPSISCSAATTHQASCSSSSLSSWRCSPWPLLNTWPLPTPTADSTAPQPTTATMPLPPSPTPEPTPTPALMVTPATPQLSLVE